MAMTMCDVRCQTKMRYNLNVAYRENSKQQQSILAVGWQIQFHSVSVTVRLQMDQSTE